MNDDMGESFPNWPEFPNSEKVRTHYDWNLRRTTDCSDRWSQYRAEEKTSKWWNEEEKNEVFITYTAIVYVEIEIENETETKKQERDSLMCQIIIEQIRMLIPACVRLDMCEYHQNDSSVCACVGIGVQRNGLNARRSNAQSRKVHR